MLQKVDFNQLVTCSISLFDKFILIGFLRLCGDSNFNLYLFTMLSMELNYPLPVLSTLAAPSWNIMLCKMEQIRKSMKTTVKNSM